MKKKYYQCGYCGLRIIARQHVTHGTSFSGVCRCGAEYTTINNGETWQNTKMGEMLKTNKKGQQ